MKKLLCGSLIALGLISGANATDLISLATNGKANESSLGVKALSNQEMNEIVGGAIVYRSIPKEYGVISNTGQKIRYTAYYAVQLEAGDSSYFNLGTNYYAAVATTYDFRTNQIKTEVVKINKNNYSDVQTISFQNNVIDRIKNFYSVQDWIKTDKNRISNLNLKYRR